MAGGRIEVGILSITQPNCWEMRAYSLLSRGTYDCARMPSSICNQGFLKLKESYFVPYLSEHMGHTDLTASSGVSSMHVKCGVHHGGITCCWRFPIRLSSMLYAPEHA